MDKKMLRLSSFCKEFDMPKTTALQLIHSKGFPAYKLGRCWYIDMSEFMKWRKLEHQRNYKYAEIK